jgi:membrane protein implicated in regulation of membrane protease activity
MTVFYNSGCVLPFLIIFNLFFGRLFFSFKAWLAIEGILVGLFVISAYIFSRRIIKNMKEKSRGNVIDVEAEVVNEREKLK